MKLQTGLRNSGLSQSEYSRNTFYPNWNILTIHSRFAETITQLSVSIIVLSSQNGVQITEGKHFKCHFFSDTYLILSFCVLLCSFHTNRHYHVHITQLYPKWVLNYKNCIQKILWKHNTLSCHIFEIVVQLQAFFSTLTKSCGGMTQSEYLSGNINYGQYNTILNEISSCIFSSNNHPLFDIHPKWTTSRR